MAAFHNLIENAGIGEIHFSEKRYDTFSDAPQASSAEAFGTQGVNISAVKPTDGLPPMPTTSRDVEPEETEADGPLTLAVFPTPDDVFDAGNLGCGDGPLVDIAKRLRAMSPDAVLEIRSTDPGVAADLPAWCRMTGHSYLGAGTGENAGRFCVRRKQD